MVNKISGLGIIERGRPTCGCVKVHIYKTFDRPERMHRLVGGSKLSGQPTDLNPVYTIQLVVKPVEQPAGQPSASCKQTFKRQYVFCV